MYTGRISEIGTISRVDGDSITIEAEKTVGALELGGSVNVSGVCVSVEHVDGQCFTARISAETGRRSTLAEVNVGAAVNLEVPLRVGDPLDGHLVQGHVDGVAKVARVDEEGAGRRLWLRPPDRVLDQVVAKGSVTVDGVSLTVAEVQRDRFSVALVPATLDATTLRGRRAGDRVNLETDLMGKLVQRYERSSGSALAAVVGALPWAGIVHGRIGVDKVVTQIAAGGAAVVWDPVLEGEGDVVFAGARLKPESFVFLLTQACGHTTVPCDGALLDRLEIPPMPGAGDRQGTAMHVSVDLASSPGTGVSAVERAATVRRLAHPDAVPGDFLRPGHVFPLAARPGLLAERGGHTEATIALCQAAGLPPVGAICEVMSPDGVMAGSAELERFALRWGLPLVDIADLTTWL